MRVDARPVIAVTMGDPGGIGPEVIVKALNNAALRAKARFVVYGLHEPLLNAADLAEIEPYWWRAPHGSPLVETTSTHDVVVLDYDEFPLPAAGAPRAPTRESGEASFRFVEDAIADARRPANDSRRADAVVTGPISKHAWALAGRGKYPGHTELFATRFGVRRFAMLFDSPTLRVVLATIHLPLMDVRNVLTIGRVFDAIDLGHEACERLGVRRPRIGVCGLNPHAGEGGLLGDEESRLIEPAVRLALDHGIDVRGPFPADTLFVRAVKGEFDLVVAMYHDQGLIPVKLLHWDEAVNVTIGLPIPRTSPDHGTAFDIAGTNRADERSMRRALELAVRTTTTLAAKTRADA